MFEYVTCQITFFMRYMIIFDSCTNSRNMTIDAMYPVKSPSILLTIIFLLAICFAVPSGLLADDTERGPDIEILRRMVEAGLGENYYLADSLAVEMQQKQPDHPIGYVMQAIMLQGEMLDYKHFDDENYFYRLLDSNEIKCKALIEDHPHDPWPHYCLGLGHGSRAVYDARKGSWWSALRHGMKARNAFTQCIERDSTFYDAYVGLGSFHYWRTVKTRLINWLPLVQDDREEGIRELKTAAEKGRFSADFAHNALVWVLIDMKEFDSAESLAVEMHEKYSGGRKFLWGIAAARLAREDYDRAESACLQLLESTRNLHDDNGHNEIECMLNLAVIYHETLRYERCIAICESAESIPLTDDVKKRLKDKLKEIDKLKKKANKALTKHDK